jgi:hypothetical protein
MNVCCVLITSLGKNADTAILEEVLQLLFFHHCHITLYVSSIAAPGGLVQGHGCSPLSYNVLLDKVSFGSSKSYIYLLKVQWCFPKG